MYYTQFTIAAAIIIAAMTSGCTESNAQVDPPGQQTTTKTRVLEAGAAVLQTNAPLGAMDVFLNGFHPLKDNPAHQMEASHFCNQVNEDFAQCVLFDGESDKANLNGIEYIISARLFESLPEKEKSYWHPHNYEILSGQLVAPNLPAVAEKELMKGKINSYGKTWHVWDTGVAGKKGDPLPYGEPHLGWSFNHDGEAHPGLVEQRDQRLKVDSQQKRLERKEFESLARQQLGIDALEGKFPQLGSDPAR